jgi:hypothetical protein
VQRRRGAFAGARDGASQVEQRGALGVVEETHLGVERRRKLVTVIRDHEPPKFGLRGLVALDSREGPVGLDGRAAACAISGAASKAPAAASELRAAWRSIGMAWAFAAKVGLGIGLLRTCDYDT